MSTGCVEPLSQRLKLLEEAPHQDIQREKRLLRQAIAVSSGSHRIRLQRELAALEEYEREKRRAHIEQATLA
ncbi:MAG: hypothetical protein ACFE89_06600 [Candidatus Hodarchaeota archaeon]